MIKLYFLLPIVIGLVPAGIIGYSYKKVVAKTVKLFITGSHTSLRPALICPNICLQPNPACQKIVLDEVLANHTEDMVRQFPGMKYHKIVDAVKKGTQISKQNLLKKIAKNRQMAED